MSQIVFSPSHSIKSRSSRLRKYSAKKRVKEMRLLSAAASSEPERAALMRIHAQTNRWGWIARQARRQKQLKVVNRKSQMGYPFRILAFRLKCLNLSKELKSLRQDLTAQFCPKDNRLSQLRPFIRQLLSHTLRPLII